MGHGPQGPTQAAGTKSLRLFIQFSRMIFFFFDHTLHLTLLILMNTRARTLPYKYLRRLDRQILEIDKVTTCTSLSNKTLFVYHRKHNAVKS